MLCVAIWYVSIRYEGEGRTANMFRASVVHLQEGSYAVCCNLVCLGTL